MFRKILIIMAILFTVATANNQFANDDFLVNDNFMNEFQDSDEFSSSSNDFDPLSGYNRFMTNVNDKAYVYVLQPVANGYRTVTPDFFREGLGNVLDNLMFPIRFTNNLLQLKFENSAIELSRFLINSTIGVAGIFDVAHSQFGLEEKKEDLGQTLGHYGVGEGFHIVLPLLGPSNLRDLVGLSVDTLANPLNMYHDDKLNYKIPDTSSQELMYTGIRVINEAPTQMDQYEAVKAGTIDLYPVLKEYYNKRREKEINE